MKTNIFVELIQILLMVAIAISVCVLLADGCQLKPARAETIQVNTEIRNNLAKVLIAEDHLGHSWEGMLDVFINRKRSNETIWEVAKRSCVAYYRKSPAWRSLQNPNGYEKIRIKQARKVVDRKLDNLLAGKRIDSVKGGTHWENEKRFGKPYWAKGMIVVARQGKHNFYKE